VKRGREEGRGGGGGGGQEEGGGQRAEGGQRGGEGILTVPSVLKQTGEGPVHGEKLRKIFI